MNARASLRVVVAWPWAAAAAGAGALAAAIALAAPSGPTLALAAIAAGVLLAVAVWRLEWAVCLLVLTLPLDVYGRLVAEPVPITVFHAVLLLCLASWGLRIAAEGRVWLRFSVMDVGIATLVAAGLWSLPHSLAPQATILGVVRLLFLWAFTLMYANVVRDERDLKRVVGFFVLTGALVGLLALAQYALPGFSFGSVKAVRGLGGGVILSRAAGFFEDPNYLAGFLSAVLVSAFALLVHARKGRDALLWFAATGVTGLALLVTFSRTGWAGAAIGLVLVVATAPRQRRLALAASALALVVAVALAAPDKVLSRAVSATDVEADRSVATRYYMLYSSVDMIRDDWVYGTGLGAYDKAYPAYRYPGAHLTIVKPHQLPLALWAEMGTPGLIAEVLLLGGVCALFWRRRPEGWTGYESLAAAGLVALLAQTFFQYYLYFEYVWLFVALAVVSTRLARGQSREARP